MEYRPRYAQPFTLTEAAELDVPVITNEIARLQNSLKHLRETQDMLREYQSTEPLGPTDPEIQKALDENEIVIGSQTERISILKMALEEKGIVDSGHYDIPNSSSTTDTRSSTQPGNSGSHNLTSTEQRNGYHDSGGDGEGGGVHL